MVAGSRVGSGAGFVVLACCGRVMFLTYMCVAAMPTCSVVMLSWHEKVHFSSIFCKDTALDVAIA